MSKKDKETSAEEEQKVSYHYIKGNGFRAIHVDGAYGGITPAGNIHMTVYNERQAIPRVVSQTLSKDGKWSELNIEESLEGVVRELEADIIMNLGTAQAVREWLDDKIETMEDLIKKRTGDENE